RGRRHIHRRVDGHERVPAVRGPARRARRRPRRRVVRPGPLAHATARVELRHRVADGRLADAAMILCDVSPFYSDAGGGIRTFHRARLDWFSQQSRHQYVLVAPGRSFSIARVTSHVWLVRVYGLPCGLRDRYRSLIDVRAVRWLLDQLRPDVVEAHDPFI